LAEIIEKRELAPGCKLFKLKAPLIAGKAKAGQFVVLRVEEPGERIPLTIAQTDPNQGTITIIFQEVGKTTYLMGELEAGDEILDLVGPLGHPTHIEKYGTVVAIGGGIGVAPIYPIISALRKENNRIISIIGARSKDYLILEDEVSAVSHELLITTDDGSYGRHGFVTDELKRLIAGGRHPDVVIAIGPVVMMQSVCVLTKKHEIKTIVSLNPIMVDATGMCGSCRVTVGEQTRFVCVDGPEFDGHQVDFEELKMRQAIYHPEEKRAFELYQQSRSGCGRC
jgi:ferredoxin--NADP+ reductase